MNYDSKLRYETDLDKIYTRSLTRKNREKDWYKKSNNGACPDTIKPIPMLESYSNEFECSPDVMRSEYEINAAKSEQCASERMAEMKHIIDKGENVDTNHIRPIKLAYEFGKRCIEKLDVNRVKQYNLRFRKRYTQLLKNNSVRNIFIDSLNNINFPLEYKNSKLNNNLRKLHNYRKSNKIHNPIVYLSNVERNLLLEYKYLITFYLGNRHLFTNEFVKKLNESLIMIEEAFNCNSNDCLETIMKQIDIEFIKSEATKQLSANEMNTNTNESNNLNYTQAFIKTKKSRKIRTKTRKAL